MATTAVWPSDSLAPAAMRAAYRSPGSSARLARSRPLGREHPCAVGEELHGAELRWHLAAGVGVEDDDVGRRVGQCRHPGPAVGRADPDPVAAGQRQRPADERGEGDVGLEDDLRRPGPDVVDPPGERHPRSADVGDRERARREGGEDRDEVGHVLERHVLGVVEVDVRLGVPVDDDDRPGPLVGDEGDIGGHARRLAPSAPCRRRSVRPAPAWHHRAMPPRRRVPETEGRAALAAWRAQGTGTDADTLARAVRYTVEELSVRAPGRSVEVRVPPYAAAQCVAGPRHTRGTPPNVVETDPQTWLGLVTGTLAWADAEASGRLTVSGTRADLTDHLPLLPGPG